METSLQQVRNVWRRIFETLMGVSCRVQIRRNGEIVFVVPPDQAKRWEEQATDLRDTKEMDKACEIIAEFQKAG